MKTEANAHPLDSPNSARPLRLYAALTNHCNRRCPWCATYSSPEGSTFIDAERLLSALPKQGDFDVQLEGGEPTTHPHFTEIVARLLKEARCRRIILSTNGVLLPRAKEALISWILCFGSTFTLKLSINHYLLEHDPNLIDLAVLLAQCFKELGGQRLLVLNVRLRKEEKDGDSEVLQAIKEAGLISHANVFYLQRIGKASGMLAWEEPFLVGTNFNMLNPDGHLMGQDLVARSEAMRCLP